MKSKKRSASEEAAIQKGISDEAKGEEPGPEDGVIATAIIPDKAGAMSQSTKRPATKMANTTRPRRAASKATKAHK